MKTDSIRTLRPLAATLSLIMLFIAAAPSLQAQHTEERHTVRSGDTLFGIARQYDITVADLREWNDLQGDELRTGMELRVTPPVSRSATRHTVSAGETLFSISRSYGVTIAEIQQWNDLDDTVISPGQVLVIHGDGETEAESRPDLPVVAEPDRSERESIVSPLPAARGNTYYTVRSGDFLNRIASEHDMTTQELRQLNNLQDDLIRVGQRLIVRQTRSTPVVDDEAGESTPQGRFVRYRIAQGESLSRTLNRFNMTREELQALNPGVDVGSVSGGQQLTVLLPPSRNFENPYRVGGGLRSLGEVEVTRYREDRVGTPTTSGELYNPSELTAAHANMALGSVIYIENPSNGRGLFVKVNDRETGNGIKLSHTAYEKLGYPTGGARLAVIFQEE